MYMEYEYFVGFIYLFILMQNSFVYKPKETKDERDMSLKSGSGSGLLYWFLNLEVSAGDWCVWVCVCGSLFDLSSYHNHVPTRCFKACVCISESQYHLP